MDNIEYFKFPIALSSDEISEVCGGIVNAAAWAAGAGIVTVVAGSFYGGFTAAYTAMKDYKEQLIRAEMERRTE